MYISFLWFYIYIFIYKSYCFLCFLFFFFYEKRYFVNQKSIEITNLRLIFLSHCRGTTFRNVISSIYFILEWFILKFLSRDRCKTFQFFFLGGGRVANYYMSKQGSHNDSTRRGLAHHYLSEEGNSSSPRRSLSLSTADSGTFSGWKRPWMSQVSNDMIKDLCFINIIID